MSLTEEKSVKNSSKFSAEILEDMEKFPGIITLPVLWGHMDAYQHMNNVHWLSFVEAARVDHAVLLSLYMDPSEFAQKFSGKGTGLVVKQNKINYYLPVKFPDSLTLTTRVKDMTQDSLVYHSKIYSNAIGKLVGESEVLMVSFDFKAGKKADLDASTVEAITKVEDDPKLTQKLAKKLPSRNLTTI